jgi:hypothetical protein
MDKNCVGKGGPLAIRPPREGDKWFMQVVREAEIATPDKWAAINRF